MRLPGLLQRLALLQHRLVGLGAAGGGGVSGVQGVVAALPAMLLLGAGLRQLGMALAQQRHLLTPARQQRAQPGRRGLEGAGCQRHQRIGRQQQALAQQAQRDLGIGALQHRAGQAQQHVAAAVIAGQAAAGIGQLGGIGRALVEPGAVALDQQWPAGLARKPFPQPVGLAPHRHKGLVVGAHQGAHQQGAQGAAELVALVALLVLAQIGARPGARGGAGPGRPGRHGDGLAGHGLPCSAVSVSR